MTDVLYKDFCKICENIATESGYIKKTAIIRKFILPMSNDSKFIVLMLFLPDVFKNVYRIGDKKLISLFSSLIGFDTSNGLEKIALKNDVGVTILDFAKTTNYTFQKTETLSCDDIYRYLKELSSVSKSVDQHYILEKIIGKCTSIEMLYVIRLIKHDLQINAGLKHILEAVSKESYTTFKLFHNLKDILEIDNVILDSDCSKKVTFVSPETISIRPGAPISPMLPLACSSSKQVFDKWPTGCFAEIKYDGERIQIHKNSSGYSYYSRNLKLVTRHKTESFDDLIPIAFPSCTSCILDGEIVMVDIDTGDMLPFGTLGIHKKRLLNARTCFFIFDILYYNDTNLLKMPLSYRKKFITDNMTPIPNQFTQSETFKITNTHMLDNLISKTFNAGLEGLVLKSCLNCYEPGKRHWLKIKKDYMKTGMMDTVDLIVLGAYYGTGVNCGKMSVYLMGCYDEDTCTWCTVTKCFGGCDKQYVTGMTKILRDSNKLPTWFKCNKKHVPDFIMLDPSIAPVWEIKGAEFSKSSEHTAGNISIRFPRMTRIRPDKDWSMATTLKQLKYLAESSKQCHQKY